MARLVIPHKNQGTPSSERYLEDALALEGAHNATCGTYVPSFLSGTSAVNVGATGFIKGWFDRTGDRVFFEIQAQLQTGFSFGAGGNLAFSLPFPRTTVFSASIGLATANPASAQRTALARGSTTAGDFKTIFLLDTSSNANWSNTVPGVWAAGNFIAISGVYRGVVTP